MTWSAYAGFLLLAGLLVLVPGPDFAVVTKNTLVGGRRRGRWTALGVGMSNATQGVAAGAGLSAIILRVQPLFQTIKWAGVGYLVFLGLQAIRSALRGEYPPLDEEERPRGWGEAASGWRQGFISNITNPKVLVFYLAVLPQFLRPGAGAFWLLAFGLSHALLSYGYLLAVTAGLFHLRRVIFQRRVRRAMDATTGAVLLGFGVRLSVEHA